MNSERKSEVTGQSHTEAPPDDSRSGVSLRARFRALPGGRFAWRVLVTVVGVAVIAVGIVLLPLPGPGWLIIFAGMGILATEYAWAARLLRFARGYVMRWTHWATRQSLPVRLLIGVVGLAFIAGVMWFSWWLAS